MFQLDYGDHRPLYEQIKEKIKELMISGALKENDKIPSVRELAGSLAINPNTIQKAYHELETEGYIYSVRAKGSFIAPQNEVAKKSDTDEIMSEFKTLVSKMNYLGIGYADVRSAIGEIYTREDDEK